MTWTWNDDDPATSASAENFNTHIELRLRALELAGGGGAVIGDEVDRVDETAVQDAIANYTEIVPTDPTKGTFVTAILNNPTGAAAVAEIESWQFGQKFTSQALAGKKQTVFLFLTPGESYYFPTVGDGGCTVFRIIEKSIG